MARLVKIVLLALAALAGIVALAAVALFLFFDPNDFRDDIAAGVKESTGRDLVISGDISLSLFPWLAVEIGETALGNAPGFGDEPMLSFDRASLSVKLMPLLLRQEVSVGTASLESLVVNLEVNETGVSNLDDLGESSTDDEDATENDTSSDAPMLDIENVSVTDARLSYRNAQDGSATTVSGLSFQSGQIAVGSPFDVNAEFNFDSQPDGIGGQLSMVGQFLLGEGFSTVDIEGLNIDGDLRGIASEPTAFNFAARAVAVDADAQQLSLGEMDLGILGLSMTAIVEPFSYAGDPQPRASLQVNEFSLKDLLTLLGQEPPVTADPNALTRVSFSANAAVGAEAVAMTDMQLQLDDTNMRGDLSLPKAANGQITFDFNVDSIVLDHYMAPPTDEPVADDAATTNVEIPVDTIRSLHADGRFTMDRAKLSGIEFTNLQVVLKAANDRIRLHPMSADMFDGSYQGDVSIDASGSVPSIAVNENIVDVQLASLAKTMFDADNITGKINGSFVLQGAGADLETMKRNLNGNISMELADGVYQGTDLWHQIRRARATFRGETPPEPELPAQTEFSAMSVSGAVANGVLNSNDLVADLPFMRVTGRGSASFVDGTVDYSMDARVLEKPELAQQLDAKELDDLTSIVIPLKISGAMASPSIRPDLEGLARQRVEEEVDKLRDKLFDRLLRDKKKDDDGA